MEKEKELTIAERIKQILVDELAVDESEITDSADLLLDLGADSLDKVELVMRIEEEFDVLVPEEDEDKIATVADTVKLAERLVAAKRKPTN